MEYVYCSGPLFCPEEIGGMSAIAAIIEEAGYGTFLPHRDGLEAYLMNMVNSPLNVNLFGSRDLFSRAMFALDVYQIMERCGLFVFNMNGRVPDEGGVSETAMAYAAGRPIVIYKNDYRSAFNGSDNSMVSCLATSMVSDARGIPAELRKVKARHDKLGESPYRGDNIPPLMRDTIRLGGKIWRVMEKYFPNKSEGLAGDMAREIAELCKNHPALQSE